MTIGAQLDTQVLNFISNSWPALTCVCIMIAGVLACCSPCILPVLPVYLSLLANDVDARTRSAIDYSSFDTPSAQPRSRMGRKIVLPLCFAIGVATAFATVTLAGTALAALLRTWNTTLSWVGGIIVIILGALMLIQSTPIMNRLPRRIQDTLATEHRLRLVSQIALSPFSALLLGFSFSFAWTPCVGPALSMLALTAAAADHIGWQIAYFICFTVGFVLPFILIAIVATPTTVIMQKYRHLIERASMVGGAFIIVIGIMMVCGVTMRTPAALSFNTSDSTSPSLEQEETVNTQPAENSQQTDAGKNSLIAPKSIIPPEQRKQVSFGTVPIQGGDTRNLDTPASKVTILTCFATWCGPCKHELPYLQKYYETTCQQNASSEVNIYLVSQPTTLQNKQGSDEPQEVVEQFLSQKKVDIPCIFDTTGALYQQLNVEVFPTSYIVDEQGRVAAVITGAVPLAVIEAYVQEIGAE